MSEENVAVVREAQKVWNAGDMERLSEFYAADIIVRAPPGWPEPGPFVGREAVFEQFRRLRSAWDRDTFEFVTDPISAADRVIARMDWSVVGHGPSPGMDITIVWTVRNGLIRDIEYFWDYEEALRTFGVSP